MTRTRLPILFFAAVTLLYLSFSAGTIVGLGYNGEEMAATEQIGARLLGSRSTAIEWPRNGVVDLVFHAPFLLASRLGGSDFHLRDRFVSFEPVLLTAALITLLFTWLVRITGRFGFSCSLALIAGFCTFLWPYASIGLEPLQSLFVLMTGFLALERRESRGWPMTLTFALCSAIAVSAKSTGAFLIPATLYCAWSFFKDGPVRVKHRSAKILVAMVIVFGVFAINAHVRAFFWQVYGGSRAFILSWAIHDPLAFLFNLISFLASGNKGLIVFAPITLLAVYLLPRTFESHRPIVYFALLTLGGLAGGYSLLTNWADETWGPRYLHAAVAPMVVAMAPALSRFGDRARRLALAATAIPGLLFAFLGVFFFYGSLQDVAIKTSQNTLQAFQADPVWNHITFNARLLKIWAMRQSGRPVQSIWVPEHRWFFDRPADAPDWKEIDLGPYAQPIPSIIRDRAYGIWYIYAAALAVGVPVLLFTAFTCIRLDRKVAKLPSATEAPPAPI